MNALVFIEPAKIDAVPFTTSDIIAEYAGMNHRRVKDAIRKHETELLSFGLLGAYQTESTGGRPSEGRAFKRYLEIFREIQRKQLYVHS